MGAVPRSGGSRQQFAQHLGRAFGRKLGGTPHCSRLSSDCTVPNEHNGLCIEQSCPLFSMAEAAGTDEDLGHDGCKDKVVKCE